MPHAVDQIQVPLYTDGSMAADDYAIEPGVCVLPLAEDPPTDATALKAWSPVAVLRLHAPYRIRRHRGQANKQNAPPVVPEPVDAGKFVFIRGSLSFSNSLNSTLATFDWAVSSEYYFVENCVSRNQDGFVLTGAPWTWRTTVFNLNLYPGANPEYGAVASANPDAMIGYRQGVVLANNLYGAWEYNTSSYFPGPLFSDEMVNGGVLQTSTLVSG